MKRLNPKTGKPFKFGTPREDGFLFRQYHLSKPLNKDGFYQECWLQPNIYENQFSGMRTQAYLWGVNNRKRKQKYDKHYCMKNRSKRNAQEANRRSAKLNRTPPWLNDQQLDDIKDFYIIAKMFQLYTGEMYHVDHIEPLRGKDRSGLHVPWNLQVLPYKENIRKGNR